jgi:mannose-6-phosphate isomerase-like protein (cupin superfamily)
LQPVATGRKSRRRKRGRGERNHHRHLISRSTWSPDLTEWDPWTNRDVRAFGINSWTAPVGAPVIERHSETDGDEEVYVVVRGRVRFTIDDETFDAGPAMLVHVRPDTLREAIAIEAETLVLAIGAKPGEAFEPKSWEDFQIAFAEAYARGEEEARSLLREMLARDPDAWQPAYNAACFEALTGKIDAAFEHLAHALALGPPRVRQLAADGEDFAALRSDPRWQQLIG